MSKSRNNGSRATVKAGKPSVGSAVKTKAGGKRPVDHSEETYTSQEISDAIFRAERLSRKEDRSDDERFYPAIEVEWGPATTAGRGKHTFKVHADIPAEMHYWSIEDNGREPLELQLAAGLEDAAENLEQIIIAFRKYAWDYRERAKFNAKAKAK